MSIYKNKVVWITGASSGIGEALAIEFSKLDAYVVISARREEELLRVRVLTKNPEKTYVVPFDLTDISILEEQVLTVIGLLGRIDVLIHNGGISHRSLAIETPLEVTRKLFEVDFFSYVALTKAVLPYFIKQKGGQIGVVSSLAGKIGVKKRSAYSAAKHALLGYFNTLRAELYDENIKVTIFCPGAVYTNISYHALLADGTENNRLEDNIRDGISADLFAKKAIRGLEHNKNEVYNGGKDNFIIYVQYFFPTLFSVFVRKSKF